MCDNVPMKYLESFITTLFVCMTAGAAVGLLLLAAYLLGPAAPGVGVLFLTLWLVIHQVGSVK